MAKAPSNRHLTLSVSAPLLDAQGTETRPATMAYAFSQGGRSVGFAAMDAKGQATFDVALGEGPTGLRVLVG
ncbi:MAG TPA: hypothetical protein VK150_07300, partial [Geothrix sp.]|nr:hypothetical protein [Geothrix sp.]